MKIGKDKKMPDFVKDHLNGNTNPQTESAATAWLAAHINDSDFDAELDNLFDNVIPDNDADSFEQSKRKIDAFIEFECDFKKKEHKTRRRIIWGGIISVAAVVTAFILFNHSHITVQEPVRWHEIYTGRGETESLILPDGTALTVNPGTKVIYPSHFGSGTRTIYVDGEIYADVAKDPQKPFIVSANDTRIKVHGTRFNVKAFAEMDEVEVALICGSVTMEVCGNDKSFSRTLRPGEFVRYNKEDGTVEDYNINMTALEYGQSKNLRFINQSLEEIANDLERHFNVRIFIEDEHLAQTQYYASFVNNEDLDQILNALNSNKAMKIKKKNNTIVISLNR